MKTGRVLLVLLAAGLGSAAPSGGNASGCSHSYGSPYFGGCASGGGSCYYCEYSYDGGGYAHCWETGDGGIAFCIEHQN